MWKMPSLFFYRAPICLTDDCTISLLSWDAVMPQKKSAGIQHK